jgi:hypothetical protein
MLVDYASSPAEHEGEGKCWPVVELTVTPTIGSHSGGIGERPSRRAARNRSLCTTWRNRRVQELATYSVAHLSGGLRPGQPKRVPSGRGLSMRRTGAANQASERLRCAEHSRMGRCRSNRAENKRRLRQVQGARSG